MSRHPRIFVAAFTSADRQSNDLDCQALAEDGEGLAECCAPDVESAKRGIGLTSQSNHKSYATHYPDGYDLEWVNDPANHSGWQRALKRNRAKAAS